MATSFVEQYQKREGAYATAAPAAPPPAKPTTGPLANVPIPPPGPMDKLPVPSFVDQYKNRTGAFATAPVNTTPPPSSPEAGKVASMAAFLDDTPPQLRALGAAIAKLNIKPAPMDYVSPGAAVKALDIQPGPQDKLPKTLKDAFFDYIVKPTARLGYNIGVGEASTVESGLGAFQWLGVDAAKEPAERLQQWINAAQGQKRAVTGAPQTDTFFDQLGQGVGSSIPFFIAGLGAGSVAQQLTRVSTRAALIFGGSVSAFLEAGSEAGNLYQQEIQSGKSRAQASDEATKSFIANAILVGLTNRFGVFNPDASGFVRRLVMSAPIEGVQEAGQQIIQNVLQGNDPLQGTGSSFLIGSIVGGLMGAGIEHLTGESPSLEGDQNVLKNPAPQEAAGAPEAPATAPEAPKSAETPQEAVPTQYEPPEAPAPTPAPTFAKGENIQVYDQQGNLRAEGPVIETRTDGVVVMDQNFGMPLLYNTTTFNVQKAADVSIDSSGLENVDIPEEMQQRAELDWQNTSAEKFLELSQKLDDLEKKFKNAKGPAKEQLAAEGRRVGDEMARLENEHLAKWAKIAKQELLTNQVGTDKTDEELAAEHAAALIERDRQTQEILAAQTAYYGLPVEQQYTIDDEIAAGKSLEEIGRETGVEAQLIISRSELDGVVSTLEQDIKDIYAQAPNAQQELENMMAELLELSAPGQRLMITDEIGNPTGEVKGIESTFPKWLPEDLRSMDLFRKVFGGLSSIDGLKFPRGRRPKQRWLYHEALATLDSRLGVDTRGQRDAILDLYGDPYVNTGLAASAETAPVSDSSARGGEANRAADEAQAAGGNDAFRLKRPGPSVELPQTAEEAATTYWEDVLQPEIDEGRAVIIGADDLKDYFNNDYDVTRHPIYSAAADTLFKRALTAVADPLVKFTAGGPGSGKSDFIVKDAAANFSGIIYDSTAWNVDGMQKQIAAAKAAGKSVEVYGIVPDLVRARAYTFVRSAAGQHPVSETAFARTHAGAINTMLKLIGQGVDVWVLDTRNITTREQVAAATYERNPVALLEKVRYSEEHVRATVQEIGADNAQTFIAGGQGGARELSQENGPTQKLGNLAFNIRNFIRPDSDAAVAETDKIVARSEIARQLAKGLGVPVRTGRFRDKALGIFKPYAHVIRLQSKLGDLRIPTLVHEAAHYIDYTLMGQPTKTAAGKSWRTSKFVSSLIKRDEVNALLVEYGGTPNSKSREAFAEFVRFWVTQPKRAATLAPKFAEVWEKEIMPAYPEVRDILLTTRADYERWRTMPAVSKVVSQISFGERSKTLSDIKDKIVEDWHTTLQRWVDDLYPVKRFSDLAKDKGVSLTLEEDPYILARLTRGWVGKASVFLERGTFDVRFWKEENGRAVPSFTGKGFRQILAPVAAKQATADLSAYLVARRAVELNDREIHSGIEQQTAKEALAQLSSKHPEFAQVAAELDDYQTAVLDYVYHSGLLDTQTYANIRELNKKYVPFFRVIEEAETRGFMGKTMADLRAPIKRIKGSDRDIIDPLESIVKNTYAFVNAAERNRVGISMANLSTKHPELAQLFEKLPANKTKVASVKVQEVLDSALGPMGQMMLPPEAQEILDQVGEKVVNIFRPSFFNKANELTVVVDGRPETFHVDPQIYKAMQGTEVEDVGIIWKLLSYPARWLRAGATLTPEFMVRNPARDMMSAYVYSEYGFMPPVDLARGLYGTFAKDNDYWLWRMGGGEQSMLVSMDRTTLRETYEDLTKKYNLKKYANPVEDLRLVSEFSEKMTRLGNMKAAISRGANPLEAAFSSREVTLDFAKVGAKARSINLIIAFFNAQIQGSVRMVRAFQEAPYRTTAKTLMGITLPSVLLALWNAHEPDWPEIPQWQKNLFWMIKINGIWWRFPKPFELGILFGSIPERIIESMQTGNPNIWPELRKSITDGASPSLLPTSILPIIENTTNYSFFLDRNIVPDSAEGLPPFAQYTAYTSETAKQIGKWLDYSPAKIDNLIHGYFAGLGDYATAGIDKLMQGLSPISVPTAPTADPADLPLIKAFVVRDPLAGSSESVNEFYVKAEQALAAKTYYDNLVKNGQAKPAQQWYANHSAEIALSNYYGDVRTQLATLRRLQSMARDSQTLSADAKRKKIDEIGALMTDLAHKAITITLKK